MFLKEELKDEEKRKFRRVDFREPINYQFSAGKDFGGCLSCDLSKGGIRVSFNGFIPLGTEVTINIKLPQAPGFINIRGKVAWVRQLPFSDRYQVGLKFEESNVSLKAKENIAGYVKTRHF